MKPHLLLPVFCILLLLLPSSVTQAQEWQPGSGYTDSVLGIAFPAELVGMKLEIVTDYEAKTAGLGLGLSYRAETKKADVYIYNMGQSSIPSDLNAALVSEHFQAVTNDLGEMERMGRYQNVKIITPREEVRLGPYSFLHAVAEFTQEDIPRISHIYLGVIKNQFVKIRFTYFTSAATDDEKALKEFLADLSKRFGEIKQ